MVSNWLESPDGQDQRRLGQEHKLALRRTEPDVHRRDLVHSRTSTAGVSLRIMRLDPDVHGDAMDARGGHVHFGNDRAAPVALPQRAQQTPAEVGLAGARDALD